MPQLTPLIAIVNEIESIFTNNFKDKTYWIKADIFGVNRKGNICYLDFIDKTTGEEISINGICLYKGCQSINLYETMTGQSFISGINITCKVAVRYYKPRSRPQLEVLEIDYVSEVGRQELEKKQNLERLLKESPKNVKLENGRYITTNNKISLPIVIQRIALITASKSDGERDFLKSILSNKYAYDFVYVPFHATMQGGRSVDEITARLKEIELRKEEFDVVVICRGGGSDIDFHVFNDFNLANYACSFPVPILTGIGHDRNTSIIDLVTTQLMNPAQVGAFIIERNMRVHANVQELDRRLERAVDGCLSDARDYLEQLKDTVKNLSPENILKKGFAIVSLNDKIITNPTQVKKNMEITTLLKASKIYSKVSKINKK